MDVKDLRSMCKQLPGVSEDIKWEDHLCFNVGGKMFLLLRITYLQRSHSKFILRNLRK